jgi:hypothetical protein
MVCSKVSSKLSFAGAALTLALSARAQTPSLKIDLPKDSPVAVLSIDSAGSHAMPRGGAYYIDLHASLSLRNSSQKHIRGVVLAVQSQEVTLAGTKATVSRPSLNVAPGDAFSVPIEQTLTRSLRAGDDAPSVEIQLDGVLFDDLSFYGPDKLRKSQRTLTVWELEARQDRKYFKTLLDTAGAEGLGTEIRRQVDLPQARVQVRGRATNADPEREMQFALLHPPDAPVDLTGGTARISGNEASAPRFDVHSVSKRAVRYMEIGWIVKDQDGHEFLAASLPADLNLSPGQSSQVVQDSALRFPERTSIQSMRAFVSTVEFDNGSYWILSRKALEDPQLRNVVAPSPEEQRLSQIYLKKGLNALIEELKKF